jgi:hypothetical protein
MQETTKRKWAIAGLIVFALIILGQILGTDDTCDDNCQLQKEEGRLECIYNASDPNNC